MPSEGSPPLEMAPSDWTVVAKSAGWTLLAAVVGAALTALADTLISSTLPELKDRGVIDVVLFGLLTTLVDAFRKAVKMWLTDTRLYVALLAAILILPGAAMAAEPTVLSPPPGLADGDHHVTITVRGGELVGIRPLKTLTWGSNPSPPTVPPPTNPPPGNPSPFEAEVERLTKDTLSKGGTATTGAALSSVYSLVADEVATGRMVPASALPAIKAATDLVLAKQADGGAWTTWRTSIGDALTILNQQGQLGTKDQVSAALKQISGGLNRATGFNQSPVKIATWGPGQTAIAKADGILGGIDLPQLIELIKLVMELLKLFGVGK